MSARPDSRGQWDAPADLDLESMPSFLTHPPAANDMHGSNPLMRRRRSMLPVIASMGLGVAMLAGAGYLLVSGPVAEVATAEAQPAPVVPPAAPMKAQARSAVVEAPETRAPIVTGGLRETMTASADPVSPVVPQAVVAPAPPVVAAPPPEPVREMVRLEPPRIAPEPPAVERPAPAIAPPPPPEAVPGPVPRVPSAEAERALKRAEALLEQGDISAARLFLERAAEGGSARAQFRLAETSDPRALQRWGARGIKGSPEKARELYRKAQASGETEAAARLSGLPAR